MPYVERYRKAHDWVLEGMQTYEVIEFKGVKCTGEKHRRQIDELYDQLVECCLESDIFLPRVKLEKNNTPYLEEEVQP